MDWPEGGQGQGSSLYQESLYYLSSYGTHLALVSFLMRHDNMKDALQHLLSKVRGHEGFRGQWSRRSYLITVNFKVNATLCCC